MFGKCEGKLKKATIIMGWSGVISVQIFQDGQPYDLSSVDGGGPSGAFPGAVDNVPVICAGSIPNPKLGEINIPYSATKSDAMVECDDAGFEVFWTESGAKKGVQFIEKLDVKARMFGQT